MWKICEMRKLCMGFKKYLADRFKTQSYKTSGGTIGENSANLGLCIDFLQKNKGMIYKSKKKIN